MKAHFTGLAIAALLVIGPTLPGYAEDAAAPAVPAAPAAAQTEAPPPSVPRPSLAPKAAEPAPLRGGRAGSTPASALRLPSLATIRLLSDGLLAAVSDLLAASLPEPDPLEPDTLGVQFLMLGPQPCSALPELAGWITRHRLSANRRCRA